jgi:hypothetical protein
MQPGVTQHSTHIREGYLLTIQLPDGTTHTGRIRGVTVGSPFVGNRPEVTVIVNTLEPVECDRCGGTQVMDLWDDDIAEYDDRDTCVCNPWAD